MSKNRTRMTRVIASFGVLPAAAVLTLTAPGAAHASDWFGQGQYGDQSNSTEQNSSAQSRAVQVAPATNVNVGGGDQTIYQANRNGSRASSGNSNVTGQNQRQNQAGGAAVRLSAPVLGQGQGGDQSNATRQNSEARSEAKQYAPATNIGGGPQRVVQGNGNASDATSGNGNLTGQHQLQNQGLH